MVCHVRPRCEKKLAAYCQQEGIGHFLPVLVSEKIYGNRTRTHTLPLFSGYVFVRCPEGFQSQLKQNQNCANVLAVVDQSAFQKHMEAVQQALESKISLEIVPFIEKGKRVKITKGPFAGIEGIVTEVHGQDHIVISIDLIQQSVAFKADWSILKPAD